MISFNNKSLSVIVCFVLMTGGVMTAKVLIKSELTKKMRRKGVLMGQPLHQRIAVALFPYTMASQIILLPTGTSRKPGCLPLLKQKLTM